MYKLLGIAVGVATPIICGFVLTLYDGGALAGELNHAYAVVQVSAVCAFGIVAAGVSRRQRININSFLSSLQYLLPFVAVTWVFQESNLMLYILTGISLSACNIYATRFVVYSLDFKWFYLNLLRVVLFFGGPLFIYFSFGGFIKAEINLFNISNLVFLACALTTFLGLHSIIKLKGRYRHSNVRKHNIIGSVVSSVLPVILSYYERLVPANYHTEPSYFLALGVAGGCVVLADLVNRYFIHHLMSSRDPCFQANYGLIVSLCTLIFLGILITFLFLVPNFVSNMVVDLELDFNLKYKLMILSFILMGSTFSLQSAIYALGFNDQMFYMNFIFIVLLVVPFLDRFTGWEFSASLVSYLTNVVVLRFLCMFFLLLYRRLKLH